MNSDYRRVEKILLFLEESHREQPSLDEISRRMGMSKYHLQRLFTRWAGISPKRFLQFLTVEHAKRMLRDSDPVLATSFASGLSGPARLHDLFLSTEAVTPGEYRSRGVALEIKWGCPPTPFGSALLGLTGRGLCHLSFLPSSEPDAVTGALAELRSQWPGAHIAEAREEAADLAKAIFSPVSDTNQVRPLSLLLKGTSFQIKVWSALLRLPPATLTTYGRLATLLGVPGAARAVGSALAGNPIGYLIPCHRVIRGMGLFGEYRWGPVRKKAMVAWEASRSRVGDALEG
jgi:AraC family transcriptional regulator of adaptative response/methylated-DNA-[protein]-cysteine methyltransferase